MAVAGTVYSRGSLSVEKGPESLASKALATLAERLGVEPARLASLEAYTQAELQELDAVVSAAIRREDEAIESGLQQALNVVPLPLRARARALLFPGGDHE